MKRELIQNIKVFPYTSEEVIDRDKCLSGILAVKVGKPTGSPSSLAVKVALTETAPFPPFPTSSFPSATRRLTMTARSASTPTLRAGPW